MSFFKRFIAKMKFLFAKSGKSKNNKRLIGVVGDDGNAPKLGINDDGTIHYFGTNDGEAKPIQDESINYRKPKDSDEDKVVIADNSYSYGETKSFTPDRHSNNPYHHQTSISGSDDSSYRSHSSSSHSHNSSSYSDSSSSCSSDSGGSSCD